VKLELLGVFVLSIAFGSSCAATPDNKRVTDVVLPDFKVYSESVDVYLQRRCGTLDCHGQPGRAYRIYGFGGFRLYNEDAGLVSGDQQTTPAEVRANFQAAVSLEPEEMSRVIAKQGDDESLNRLLLLRKPLNNPERHKGGPAMAQDDAGYKCVVAWLRVKTVRPVKENPADFEVIPQEERENLPPLSKRSCDEAASMP
jgi:hypothetical protein